MSETKRPTNHEIWTDRLSEYLDGTLPLIERVQVRRHLAECRACTAVLAELRAVVARASDLDESPPSHDLWAGVVAGIEGRSAPQPLSGDDVARVARRIRPRVDLPRLVAASIVLLAVAGGGIWITRSDLVNESPVGGAGQVAATSVGQPAPIEDERTGAVVAELEQALADNRALLDPSTIAVIESNLAILDAALGEARRALAEDPTSTYLNRHLADTMRRKLQLLRDANALAQQ
jgi:anti-sigma factor RsiW